MKHFSIYSSLQEESTAYEAIQELFSHYSLLDNGSGYDIKLKDSPSGPIGNIHIKIKAVGEDPDDFSRGMLMYYMNMDIKDEELKKFVPLQIAYTNTMINFFCEDGISDSDVSKLYELSKKLGGLIYLENSHLYDSNGNILVYPDGNVGDTKYLVQIAKKEIDLGEEIAETKDNRDRRNKTILFLESKNIPIGKTLPLLADKDKANLRSLEEIAKRASTLLVFIQLACDVAQNRDVDSARDFVKGYLTDFGTYDGLTPKELAFLESPEPNINEAFNLSWQYEAYWVFIWALGFIDELKYPNEICDCDFAINLIKKCENIDEFISNSKLRTVKELLDQADFTYMCHWACVDNRINGKEVPGGLNNSVIIERHRAFNYLFNIYNQEWDDITLDT